MWQLDIQIIKKQNGCQQQMLQQFWLVYPFVTATVIGWIFVCLCMQMWFVNS